MLLAHKKGQTKVIITVSLHPVGFLQCLEGGFNGAVRPLSRAVLPNSKEAQLTFHDLANMLSLFYKMLKQPDEEKCELFSNAAVELILHEMES